MIVVCPRRISIQHPKFTLWPLEISEVPGLLFFSRHFIRQQPVGVRQIGHAVRFELFSVLEDSDISASRSFVKLDISLEPRQPAAVLEPFLDGRKQFPYSNRLFNRNSNVP